MKSKRSRKENCADEIIVIKSVGEIISLPGSIIDASGGFRHSIPCVGAGGDVRVKNHIAEKNSFNRF